jgi:hypothetical protein
MLRNRALRVLPVAVAALVLAAGCTLDEEGVVSGPPGEDSVRLWVEPERADCVGVGPMECLQVRYTEDGEPELFYDEIAGFEFQEGTSYVIDVRVEPVPSPPADGSSLAYTLVEVVSEEPAG